MKSINVHIGEVKIAKKGETLKAILGSCVGVGMIWKDKGICGLAHCLLPEGPISNHSIGGRFVNQAIPSLLILMKVRPEDFDKIEVVLAGGGNMTNPDAVSSKSLVGTLNFQVAEREVKKRGLRLIFSEGGGEEGRRISIDSATCAFKVEKIPRIIGAA